MIATDRSYSLASQQPQTTGVGRANPAPLSTADLIVADNVGRSRAGGAAQPDFTSITRKEVFDWMNSKIASGEMSLDDSSPFLGMSMKIKVGAGMGSAITLDDQERVNVVQIAQDGIAGAVSRNDHMLRERLETALRHMQSARVDQRA